MNLLLIALAIAVGINMLMFLPAYFKRTDKLTDISYAITFAVLAFSGLIASKVTFPSIVLAMMIFIWAFRLGSYLLIRIKKIGSDKRFDGRRENFWSFAGFWLLQGFTVWVVLIPSTMFFSNCVKNISLYAYMGVLVFIVGLLIETVADIQKYQFKNNPENKGRWIASGLWKYSRHPNYFGEILLWIGVFLYTVFALNTIQSVVGFVGPLYIGTLIIFVSGIPMLEKSSDRRWGEDEDYKEYKRKTSILIPFLPKS